MGNGMVRKSINNISSLSVFVAPTTSQANYIQYKCKWSTSLNGLHVHLHSTCIALAWLMDALMYESGAGGGKTFPISPGNFTLADLVSE